jgi:hypothetical protein
MPHFSGSGEHERQLYAPFRAHSARVLFMGPIAGEAPALLKPGRGPTKMTVKRTLTSLTAAMALAATTLAPMATWASADPWHNGHGGEPLLRKRV